MNSDQAAIRVAIARHGEWLAGLRWVGPVEVLLCGVLVLFSTAIGIAAMVQGRHGGALAIGLAHIALLLCVVTTSQRWLTTPLLGTLCLSLLNYAIALMTGGSLLKVIENIYGWMLLPAGLLLQWRFFALQAAWSRIREYQERDDFRWLLTAAPLLLRWRVLRVLRALVLC